MSFHLFTSESVTEGHPDKLCDAISDAVLDAIMTEDPAGRVACETAATTGLVLVMGEISTSCYVDLPKTVRNTVRRIGYTDAAMGFDYKMCAVISSIDEQSPDIAMGVNASQEYRTAGADPLDLIGAGDQGMVFGYACNETEELMPLAISLAHKLTRRLAEVRKTGDLPFLWPDGKAQVTIAYEDEKPLFCPAVVISSQHNEEVSLDELRQGILEAVVSHVVPENLLNANTKYYINPTGRFVVGGPNGDSGLTGRKIIVDTYGGYARHGGGAFSGKDPTKVDRSAAYMARYVAKNLVAAGVADRLEISIAYAIGVARPVSVTVETFGTGKISDEKITKLIERFFDLRPAAIIQTLDLRRPIYSPTSSYGHFGRMEDSFSWEKTPLAEQIAYEAGIK